MGLLLSSLGHTWEPFVLVTGLLLIGHVAAGEGLFAAVGGLLARLRGGAVVLLAATLAAVAVVSVVLNLDTAVVFMTPVALHAARARRVDEAPFLYGAILMSNAASLLLLGSNLTNMLVTAAEPVAGARFARAMALPWLAAVLVTWAGVALWHRRALAGRGVDGTVPGPGLVVGPGVAGAAAATVAMLVSAHPALVVLGCGLLAEVWELARRRVRWADAWGVVNLTVVGPLFLLAVLVGWLGRGWDGPARLLGHHGALFSALVAAGASLVINNLPAASLLAGHHLVHPLAVLVGLDLGPNAFATGAMSTLLWHRIARREGADPSYARAAALGAPVALATILAAVALL